MAYLLGAWWCPITLLAVQEWIPTHSVALLTEVEAVVGDVGDVNDLGAPERSVQRGVEQLHEGLDDDREILAGVVAAAVHLR